MPMWYFSTNRVSATLGRTVFTSHSRGRTVSAIWGEGVTVHPCSASFCGNFPIQWFSTSLHRKAFQKSKAIVPDSQPELRGLNPASILQPENALSPIEFRLCDRNAAQTVAAEKRSTHQS